MGTSSAGTGPWKVKKQGTGQANAIGPARRSPAHSKGDGALVEPPVITPSPENRSGRSFLEPPEHLRVRGSPTPDGEDRHRLAGRDRGRQNRKGELEESHDDF